MRRIQIAAVALSLGLHVSPSRAEEPPIIPRGERVRVTYLVGTQPTSLVGRFEASTSESLVVAGAAGGEGALQWSTIRGLERYDGRHGHAGTGALIGFGIGLGAGIITGVSMAQEPDIFGANSSVAVIIGSAITLGGTGLGTLVGALIRSDRWREVPLSEERSPSQP